MAQATTKAGAPEARPAVPGQPRPLGRRGPSAAERSVLRQTPGLYQRAWRMFRQNKLAMVSLCFLVLMAIFVLGADLISRYVTGFSYSENHLGDQLKPIMTDGYILGSDGNGRDVLTRLAYGGRI